MTVRRFPDWFYSAFNVALAGEIYPQIRAIAVRYIVAREFLMVYYLDREPTDFDKESIDVVYTNLEATAPIGSTNEVNLTCIYSTDLIKDLDALDGFVYTRREYEMQDNPSQVPTYSTGYKPE